jgi:hypothetical protein
MDLISMHGEVIDNPLLNLMDLQMKLWADQSSLAEESSSKKRRMSPLVTETTPATEALEQFLRFASKDTTLSLPLPMAMPMDDDSSTSSSSDLDFESTSTSSTSSFSHMYKTKYNYRFASLNDVTRGMAEISHH